MGDTPDQNPAVDVPPEKWFRFLGLVVIRKTDLLAGAAFFIAVSTSIFQLLSFLRGADVALYHPDTVYIFFDKNASGFTSTRVAGQVSFTNGGDAGRNAIIRSVTVFIKIGTDTYRQEWFSFASLTRTDTHLQIAPKEPAHPIVVSGGSAGSEMIAFSPRKHACASEIPKPGAVACEMDADYISDDLFLEKALRVENLELIFVATQFNSRKSLESTCIVPITATFKTVLPANDWIAASCVSKVSS